MPAPAIEATVVAATSAAAAVPMMRTSRSRDR
jgi:hypothetical protein